MKKRFELPAVFFFLLLISLVLHRSYINEFPRHIHAWTQSDRYALSLGFLDNNFDFFHPVSYNLRPDATFHPIEDTGITPVEPPVPELIVAVFMKVFGTHEPWVFRLYSILISCLGLSALYSFLKRSELSIIPRIAVIGFIFLSPVYFYYQSGFIPTISALSCVMIGINFFFNNDKRGLAFIFFTLAALVRSPFIFPLLIAGYLHFRETGKFRPFIIGLAVFSGFWFWNRHLASMHGSMFLRKLMNATSFAEFTEYLSVTWNNWITSYYSNWHYLLVLLVIVLLSIHIRKSQTLKVLPGLSLFAGLWLVFDVIYFILMQAQYMAHDYYFLDSFFLPLVLLFVAALLRIRNTINSYKYAGAAVIVLFLGIASYTNASVQEQRRSTGSWDRGEITYLNFEGSEQLLDELGIKKDAKVLVIDAYMVNGPLIQLNRKGYTLLTTNETTIPEALKLPFDYVVIQDDYVLSDVYRLYPQIQKSIKKVGGNGKISLFERFNSKSDTADFKSFFGLESSRLVFEHKLDSCRIDSLNEFPCSMEIPVEVLKSGEPYFLLFTADADVARDVKDLVIVCDITDSKGEHLLYKTYELKDYVLSTGQHALCFMFPVRASSGTAFKLYFHNPGLNNKMILKKIQAGLYRS